MCVGNRHGTPSALLARSTLKPCMGAHDRSVGSVSPTQVRKHVGWTAGQASRCEIKNTITNEDAKALLTIAKNRTEFHCCVVLAVQGVTEREDAYGSKAKEKH